MNIGQTFKESQNRLLTTIAYRFDGQTTYAFEGAIFTAGAAIQWLRDNLEFFDDAKESEALAQSVQAFQTADLLEAFEKDSGSDLSRLRIDGGLVANKFVCQFLADILNAHVEVPEIIETTALGAAYLAGLQCGVFDNLDDISKAWQAQRAHEPDMNEVERAHHLSRWREEVQRIL